MAQVTDTHAMPNKFQLMWDEAEQEFKNRTNRSLRVNKTAGNTHSLVDQFLAKLSPDDSDDQSSRRKKKAAHVVGFVLNFVQTVGGLASQAASMVFGPADMCFNAFSFLIDIPKKIGKVYEDLIQLFGDMSTTLLEFQVLEQISAKAVIEPQLMITTHTILIAFVNICGRYLKFLEGGKLHRFNVAFRSVFLDDDCGVLDELKNFKNLARQQSSMIGTVTYKHVLDVEEAIHHYGVYQPQILSRVDTLVASDNDRKAEILIQKSLKLIEEKLRIDSATAEAPLQTLVETQKHIIDPICSWLFDTPEYKNWTNHESRRHLICIGGWAKTGKSFLVAAVARELERQFPAGQGTTKTPYVLHYLFPTRNQENALNDREVTNMALKILALQFARRNKNYAQQLEKSLSTSTLPFEENLSGLWTALNLHRLPDTLGRDVYILIGGLNRLGSDVSHELLSLWAEGGSEKAKMPKLLVTGSTGTFANVGVSALIVNIRDHDHVGVSHFVESEMSKIEILREEHPNIKKLRASLSTALPKYVYGDFLMIKQRLQRVVSAIDNNKTHDQVLAALHVELDDDFQPLIRRSIDDLEKGLNAEDIADINFILAWYVHGLGPAPDIAQLEAILLLDGRCHPVMPLEKRLKKKCLKILSADISREITQSSEFFFEGGVLRSELQDFFKANEDRTEKTHSRATRISLDIFMNENDRPTVKHFMWDLARKFNFDDPAFVQASSDLERRRIVVRRAEAHFLIIDRCLHVLGAEKTHDTLWLASYGMEYLPGHLKELLSLNLAADQRKVVCQRLISFFTDTDALEEKWEYIESAQLSWLEQDFLDVIESWFLTNEDLVQPVEKRWIKENIAKKENRGAFWLPITMIVAKKWLRGSEWRDLESAFLWINRYISLTSQTPSLGDTLNTEHTTVKTVSSDGQVASTSKADDVYRAAKWSVDNLQLDVNALDYKYYECLGSTFLFIDNPKLAIESFEKASSLENSDWRIHKHLAEAFRLLGDHENVKAHLTAAIQHPQFALQDSKPSGEYVSILAELATVEKERGQNDLALTYYDLVFKIGDYVRSTDVRCFWEHFKLLCRTGQSEKAKVMLQQTDDSRHHVSSEALLHRLSWITYPDPRFEEFACYVSAALKDQSVADAVASSFDQLIAGDTYNEHRANICFCASIVFGNSESLNGQELAFRYLDTCLKTIARGEVGDYSVAKNIYYWVHHRRRATQQLCLWRSLALMRLSPSDPASASDWEDVTTTITSATRSNFIAHSVCVTPLAYLCRNYVLRAKSDEARALMRPAVKDGLLILKDNDPKNDAHGLELLAEAFKYCGDDLNALTAWSLVVPPDLENTDKTDGPDDEGNDVDPSNNPRLTKTEDAGTSVGHSYVEWSSFDKYCSGDCKRRWQFADDFWTCKACPNVYFCSSCCDMLKHGGLERMVCHYQHEFLHVPPWSDAAYLEVGRDHVRIEGEINSENRTVGGRIVSVKEWLDIVHNDWNIEKTEQYDLVPYPY